MTHSPLHDSETEASFLTSAPNVSVIHQALRDVVLGTPDALEGLLLNVVQPATPSLLRNCVWALSNMCRGKPQPDTALLAPALPVLLKLLSCDDSEVQSTTVAAVGDITYHTPFWVDYQRLISPQRTRVEAKNTVVCQSRLTGSSRAA